jgi:hypothetical protein
MRRPWAQATMCSGTVALCEAFTATQKDQNNFFTAVCYSPSCPEMFFTEQISLAKAHHGNENT